MPYVLRQIMPPGLSARAHEATAVNLAVASVADGVIMGDYLEWSDPNAKLGFGDDRWTEDVSRAQRFTSFADAMACWKAQSTKRPFRDDGRPNRPLTAYSVTVEEV